MRADIQTTIDSLLSMGCPPLPVAPQQDPRKPNCYHQTFVVQRFKPDPKNPALQGDYCRITRTKVGDDNASVCGDYCRLDENLQPIARFTGKNPSYLDRSGYPHTIAHRQYQNRLPTQQELATWFANPLNGIGTLGGHAGVDWLDFDAKNYASQEDCDRDVQAIAAKVGQSWVERTGSGGYRIAVRPKIHPTFTNFTTSPDGEGHIGEALWEGRFTVLAPSVHPNGKPYARVDASAPAAIESLQAIGIYPTKDEVDNGHRREKRAASGVASQPTDPSANPWDIRNFAEHIPGYRVEGDYIKVQCPHHQGNSDNSLHIHISTGGYKCWSGCSTTEIYRAAKQVALAAGYKPSSPPDTELAADRRVKSRLTRQPDLNIGDKEFTDPECLKVLRDKPFVVLVGSKGTAKSQAIGELKGAGKWLSYTSLQSLARDQAAGWDGVFANDVTSSRQWFEAKGVSACVPSSLTTKGLVVRTLMLDELTKVLNFLQTSKLANKEGIRPLLIAEVERRIRETERVYAADADLTDDALEYIERVRGEKAFLVKSDRLPLQWQAHDIKGKQNQAVAEFLSRAQNLPAGKMLLFNSDDKSLVNDINQTLNSANIKTLIVTQETSGDVQQQAFLNSKGRYLPTLLNQGVRAILTSPSVCQGFSIQNSTELIDSVWGIYRGVSIDASSVAQALDRVRSTADRYIWIAERGRAYSPFSRATDKKQFQKDFVTGRSKTAQIARLSLRLETVESVDAIDWQNSHINLLSAFEVQRNQDMVAFKPSVLALLRQEGKAIIPFTLTVSAGKVKQLSDAIRTARDLVDQARLSGINGAIDLTECEAETLERKSQRQPLTQDESYALERYYLTKFYRLMQGELDGDLIKFDSKGRTRQSIKNLETVLSQAVAIDRTAKSIEQNPSTPQDWSKAALQQQLLKEAEVLPFIQGIWDGEIDQIAPNVIKPIVAELRSRATDFKVAFNFSRLDAMGKDGKYLVSDQQVIAFLLDWCGIKRVVERRRVNGAVSRIYAIDAEYLEKLKAVVWRRSEGVTPPPKDNQYRGGVTAAVDDAWLTPESLREVRETWAIADSPEVQAELRRLIPDYVLARAIA